MKILSLKLLTVMVLLIFAGLSVDSFWINAVAGFVALIMIILLHLDNVDFCRKLDRIAAGDRDVKF